MGIFGWSLPAGCGTLPGEEDEQLDNRVFVEAFPDAAGPGELYRQLYKYTACGPSLGVTIAYWEETDDPERLPRHASKTLYCSDLNKLGTWSEMDKRGELVTGFVVGSIVEGVDYDCESIEIDFDQLEDEPDAIRAKLYAAVDQVNAQANEIWMDTHGCDKCKELNGGENENGYVTVHTECPECDGKGIPI